MTQGRQLPCEVAYLDAFIEKINCLKSGTFPIKIYDLTHNQQGCELEHQRDTYPHFDYPGRYKQDASGKAFVQHRLDALRNDAVAGSGKSNSAALLPGQTFSLTEHPNGSLNINWQIVHIRHTGEQPQALEEEGGSGPTVYHNEFGVVKASTTWRARIGSAEAPHKPMVDGPQIAMVVGPDGEEIYCDQHGRVKLQFPWSRYGSSNDQSSCWVRVSQDWADGQYGGRYLRMRTWQRRCWIGSPITARSPRQEMTRSVSNRV